MKVSLINYRPGAQHHRVWLDGEEVSELCREADEEAGYVILIIREDTETGWRAKANEAGDGPAEERRVGKVRVECMKQPCIYHDQGGRGIN